MRLAVYLPLILPLLAAVTAGPLARRVHPKLATWLLTLAAVVLAACSTVALGLLAVTGIARIPAVATLGRLSLDVLHHKDPAALSIGWGSAILLAAATAAATRMIWRRLRALLAAYRHAHCLPGDGQCVVLPDEAADAFALPGWPGRIVISAGMLDALDPAEQRVLLAHERAHLASRYHVFLSAVHLAATANPLLRPLATTVAHTVERWADEHAATVTGDRRLAARTVGKAALAAAHTRRQRRRRIPELALGVAGSPVSLAGAGPIPRRVAALLADPPGRHRLLVLAVVLILVLSGISVIEGAKDLEALLELARTMALR